jgi:hypothetical protein
VGEIAQALYGYGQGHQLLASSISLPSQSARQLRAVTDMAFDGEAESYLTALPMPDLGRYALIRTWPAPESRRRGSVWSHALLIDLVAFSSLDDLTSLTSLFRRPSSAEPVELAHYERDLSLHSAKPARADSASNGKLDEMLWVIYGQSEAPVVRAERPDQTEALLLAIWQQQWPRLRRAFAFRTRYRVSTQASPFDVQIVERLERDQRPPSLPEERPDWLVRLGQAFSSPDDQLSDFLRRFGTESPDGRRDLPTLVETFQLIERDACPPLIRLVGSSFPQPGQMPSLKRYLLGAPEQPDKLWRVAEDGRLKLLLHAKPVSAFDLEDLAVEQRFDELWKRHRKHARELLAGVEFSRTENASVRASLLRTAAYHAAADDLAAVSEANPEAAIAIVKERGELLSEPTLWQGDPALVDFLLDLLAEAERDTREEVLRGLLAAQSADAAARLIEREPDLWWQALSWTASSKLPPDQAGALLDVLLSPVGAGAIGAMPPFRTSPRVLVVLATCVAPSLGLWRQVDAARWLELSHRWKKLDQRWTQLRMLVVLLAAAKSARKDAVRRGLWSVAFPPLHQALVKEELRGPDLDTLAGLLPKPAGIEEWDHAGRLRAALAIEIRRGSWPQDEIAEVLAAAQPYDEALVKALAAGKKKKKSWLRELAEAILP